MTARQSKKTSFVIALFMKRFAFYGRSEMGSNSKLGEAQTNVTTCRWGFDDVPHSDYTQCDLLASSVKKGK